MKPLNYKDITIKAKVNDLQVIEKRLVALDAFLIGTDHQIDYYFKTAKGKLKYSSGTIENLITHYERILVEGVEQTIVYRYDLNPSEKELKELFRLEQLGTTRKARSIFLLDHIKIHLDHLESGDQFIEIEAIDRKNKWTFSQLKKQCSDLQFKLGISDNDLIPTGYLTL